MLSAKPVRLNTPDNMKILFFGDIIGAPGRKALAKILPAWREKYSPDLAVANGENIAHGKGVTERTFQELLAAGIDAVTSGNHIWNHKEAISLLENKKLPLLRPHNFPPNLPGRGYMEIEAGVTRVLIINLIGRVFMHSHYDDPFRAADEILRERHLNGSDDEAAEKYGAIIVDWHAEATSEKAALGWYLDGRVSAVLGTHTHVPTADAKILPKGTAFVSDVGMVGPENSIIGVEKEPILEGFLKQIKVKADVASGPVEVNAVLVEIDFKTGLAVKIERLREVGVAAD